MTTSEQPGGRGFMNEAIAALPVIWLGVILVLSARGIVRSFQPSFSYGLPGEIANFIYAGMALAVVQILFGVYVLGLAWRKSSRFAFWFTLWAVFVICCDIGLQVATLFIGAFTQTLEPWLMTGLFTAIGIAAIVVARRAEAAPPSIAVVSMPAPAGVVLLHGFLGFIVGGALGLVVGFGAGALIVDLLDVSCFEGGCGYAAVAIALLVMIVGAIAGLVFAIWRTRRRGATPAH
jgi:hypothetical protein